MPYVTDTGKRRLVYQWEGPPKIELWVEDVTHNGRLWRQHSIVAEDGRPGAVAVTTFNGRFLLVEHYRPATQTRLLEFPRGFAAAGPTDLDEESKARADANRELLEETGVSGRARLLGFVWPDSGLIAGKVAIVAIEADSDMPGQLGDGEIDGLRWLTPVDLRNSIASGAVADGLTLSAFALWSALNC